MVARLWVFAALAFLFLFIVIPKGNAHEWYSLYCCDKEDCREAVSAVFNPVKSVWKLTDAKGFSVEAHESYNFLTSKDDKWHFCYVKMMNESEMNPLRCVYRPPAGTQSLRRDISVKCEQEEAT